MNDTQLEFGFGNAGQCRAMSHRQKRISRAQGWFQRMRQVVDRALDWQSVPPPRPEQSLAWRRTIGLTHYLALHIALDEAIPSLSCVCEDVFQLYCIARYNRLGLLVASGSTNCTDPSVGPLSSSFSLPSIPTAEKVRQAVNLERG